jgi:hypothetical protein
MAEGRGYARRRIAAYEEIQNVLSFFLCLIVRPAPESPLHVFESHLQGVEQFSVLGAGHVGDTVPEVRWLDDIMHFPAHLFLKLWDVVWVVGIPEGQRHAAVVRAKSGIILAQLLLRPRFVIVREVAQKEEGKHVVAEIIRVHRSPQLVGDVPEGVAQLFLIGVGYDAGGGG